MVQNLKAKCRLDTEFQCDFSAAIGFFISQLIKKCVYPPPKWWMIIFAVSHIYRGLLYLLNGSIWRPADGFKRLAASILVGKVGLLFLFGQVLAPKSTF